MEWFRKRLTQWYKENRRELPWRGTKNPYRIWISEIILQQTRVSQGTDYYNRFVDRFPDVELLAAAGEDEVMKLWQGLGYYSRARNLHHAAREIVERFGSVFPDKYEDIRNLKGVGDYTAAAISSIAYGLPYATVDGNVYRVISRIWGIDHSIDMPSGKKIFREMADQLLDRGDPDTFNQAMMEFGAIQCVAKSPDCSACPMADFCVALSQSAVASFPVRSKKVMLKERFLDFLAVKYSGSYFLTRREKGDIWAGLYQFPLIESNKQLQPENLMVSLQWNEWLGNLPLSVERISPVTIHLLTHQRLYIRFWSIELLAEPKYSNWIKVPAEELQHYAVPRPVEQFIVSTL